MKPQSYTEVEHRVKRVLYRRNYDP